MSYMLRTPRIHPSAGVPRSAQPLADLYDTYHVLYTDRAGERQTARVKIARNPMRTAAQQRAAAIQSVSFRTGCKPSTVSAVRVGR